MGESEVGIYSGHLLHGVLDKNQLGATPYSIVHAFYELYGSDYSCALLSAFSSLLTTFLSWEAFSLGVHDVLVNPEANKQRRKILRNASKVSSVVDVLTIRLDFGYEDARFFIVRSFCDNSQPHFTCLYLCKSLFWVE